MRYLWIAIALVVIGGVVYALLGPRFIRRLDRSIGDPTKRSLSRVESAWVRWKATSGRTCPSSIDELKPELGLAPRERFVDDWGHPFVLVCGSAAQPRCPSGLCVHSLGRDGKDGTDDDIGNWQRSPAKP